MAFISTIPEQQAPADLKQMYDKDLERCGYIPNYSRIFSHRPSVMEAWGNLLRAIKRNMASSRFELVTLTAARALKNSYCMVAHGTVLLREFFSPEQLAPIANDYRSADLSQAEIAMMAFAEQVARDATAITADDVAELRRYGLADSEIFDLAAASAAQCFFSKILDALGTQPDGVYFQLERNVREALTIQRIPVLVEYD